MKNTAYRFAAVLVSFAVACGSAPAPDTSEGTPARVEPTARSIPASDGARATLSVASWALSGEGDARDVRALTASGEQLATIRLRPARGQDDARLILTIASAASMESVELTSAGVVSETASPRTRQLVQAMYEDFLRGALARDDLRMASGDACERAFVGCMIFASVFMPFLIPACYADFHSCAGYPHR